MKIVQKTITNIELDQKDKQALLDVGDDDVLLINKVQELINKAFSQGRYYEERH